MKRFLAESRGGAAVEFALLAPFLALMFAGLGDVGNIVNTSMVVKNAAREGARAASLSDVNAAQEVVAYLNSALSGRSSVVLPAASAVSITCGAPPGSACTLPQTPGSAITVSVPVTVTMSTPVIQAILGSSFTVSASATMEVSG